jgi:hypothetical protein
VLTFSSEPDESAHEAQKAHIVGGELLKAGEDTSVLLDLVDEVLHDLFLLG